jgi:hypothetical protein
LETTYRKYADDEAKLKVYERRLFTAENDLKSWKTSADDALDRYENKPRVTQQTGDGHTVNVPEGLSIIDSIYASLTATETDILLTPRGNTTDDQAYVASTALAQEWEICKVADRTNDAVKDSLVVGIGWAKVGYEFFEDEMEVPRPDDDIVSQIEDLLGQAEAAGEEAPDFDQIKASVPLTETEKVVLSDRIVVDYVPWDMVRWDPTAKKIRDIRWVAQVSLMHVEDIKSNPVWRAYVSRTRGGLRRLDSIKADTQLSKELLGSSTPTKEDERQTVIEMHDFETGTVCTFGVGTGFFLNETPGLFSMKDDLEDKSPFVPLVLRSSPRRVRGISEMDVLKPTLEQADLYESKLATYLERMSPKVIAEAGSITESGKAAIKSQEYGAVVEYKPGTTKPEAFAPPALIAEQYAVPERLQRQMRESTGVNELQRGLFPDRRRTATETAEVVSASAVRAAEKRTRLQAFYMAIADRILILMQTFYEEERITQLVDSAGPIPWKWSAQDITGDYSLEVALMPKESKTWQTRRDDFLAFLNVFGQFAQPKPDGSTILDPAELLRYGMMEYGIPRRWIVKFLHLPEEQQQQMLAAQQTAAGMASASAGQPRPDMVPGPMSASALAAASNQGEIPPEVLMAAQGGGVGGPQSAEVISESAGATPLR